MKEIDKMNIANYKANSEELGKLKQKIVRMLSTDILKNELKRRKVLTIDWLKGSQYMEEKK